MENSTVTEETPLEVLHRELRAVVDQRTDRKIYPMTADPNIFEEEIDLDDVECEFEPEKGDNIKLFVMVTTPPKVSRIEPWEELVTTTGFITYLTKSFGTVDEDNVFFIEEDQPAIDLKINDRVEYTIIEGDYVVGKSKYGTRCESIKKIAAEKGKEELSEEAKRWFNEEPVNEKEVEENADSDTENNDGDPKMEFDALKDREPNERYYDLPYGLYETLFAKNNARRIKRYLDNFVPSELNYKTYRKRFHAMIHLEEVEMKFSFEKYRAREICIEPENKRFSIACTKITELRPPIAVGESKYPVRKLIKIKFHFFMLVFK